MIDYPGLDWQPRCLDFYQSERAVRSASALQVRKKMYIGSSDDRRRFEAQLQPLKTGLRQT